MGSIKKNFKGCAVFFGCAVGVGLASKSAFSRLAGSSGEGRAALLCAVLFIIIIYITLKNIQKIKPGSLNEYLRTIGGPWFGNLLYVLMISFLFLLFGTMSSAFCDSIEYILEVDRIFIFLFFFFTVMFFILSMSKKGVIFLSVILSPVMVWGFLWLFFERAKEDVVVFSNLSWAQMEWAADAVFFCGCLCAIFTSFIISLGEHQKFSVAPTAVCGCITAILAKTVVNMFLITSSDGTMVSKVMEMVSLDMQERASFLLSAAAALLTACVCGYNLSKAISNSPKKGATLVCLASWVFIPFDFSALIRPLYIFFGALGLLIAMAGSVFALNFWQNE